MIPFSDLRCLTFYLLFEYLGFQSCCIGPAYALPHEPAFISQAPDSSASVLDWSLPSIIVVSLTAELIRRSFDRSGPSIVSSGVRQFQGSLPDVARLQEERSRTFCPPHSFALSLATSLRQETLKSGPEHPAGLAVLSAFLVHSRSWTPEDQGRSAPNSRYIDLLSQLQHNGLIISENRYRTIVTCGPSSLEHLSWYFKFLLGQFMSLTRHI